MAATKYQVLYRYTNPNSNQFILNDVEKKYDNVFEFYHENHKIVKGTTDEILEANNDKSNLIIEGNNTANGNYNMLFKFTGTKRINKKTWVPKSTGYVIRDKNAIRDLITRAVDGDYSGDYLLIEGDTIDNGIVVAKKNISSKITVCDDSTKASNGKNFTTEELQSIIVNSTIYKLASTELEPYKKGSKSTFLNRSGPYWNYTYSNPVYTGPVFIDEEPITRSGNYIEINACVLNINNACTTVEINPENIETYEIPAHYEESAEYPYAICDTYERIEQSPWFILSTHSSLTSALEKVKAVVKSVGINNVKLIKVVPTEQFVKIN